MFKLCIFSAIILFWVAISASLAQVELAIFPVFKMGDATYHTMRVHAISIPQLNGSVAIAHHY